MMVASVCHVGDPLQLTCTGSVEFVRWNIEINKQGTLEEVFNPVHINARDDNQIKQQKVMNFATFTFTRSSDQRSLLLVSTLLIDSVSIGLNGTVVRCTDAGNPMRSVSTTIHISQIGDFIN